MVVAALAVVILPLRASAAGTAPASAGASLRIFHGNLLYHNGRTAELARVVARLDADVLAFTEYTPTHAGGMYVSPLAARSRTASSIPKRRPAARRSGAATRSRRSPLRRPSTNRPPPSVDVAGGVELYVVHPPNPLDHLARLARRARRPRRPARSVGSTGDRRRRLQRDRTGIRRSAGSQQPAGETPTSSPAAASPPRGRTTRRGCRRSCASTTRWSTTRCPSSTVVDVDLPGSDHRGFVVTVVVSRSAAAS